MSEPLSVLKLLTEKKYSIPLYQRNFAWTYDEIAQLIIDVLDSIKEAKEEYYIGTLVVSEKGDEYSIIDGQQRFTALLLISLAIQNIYFNEIQSPHVKGINLLFSARKRSDDTLQDLLDGETDNINNDELSRGYNNVKNALIAHLENDEEYTNIKINDFYEYLFEKVKIFISVMPKDLDLNLYFERFNSRGEQLEFHEIIKADLMQKLVVEKVDLEKIHIFAKIWDACSEFETPVIKFFKKKTKGSDQDEEREIVFPNIYREYESGKKSWIYSFCLDDIYSQVSVNKENKKENKKSLLSVIDNTSEIAQSDERGSNNKNDESIKYRCIINFNTFLYYALYITDDIAVDSIQLDDKKLKFFFDVKKRDKEWILQFGNNLLKLKFIFDNLIIRNSLETAENRVEGDWFLQKAHRIDKNDKKGGHLYVQTRYNKNSFEHHNREILMLQSMFAVTFTAYKDTKWLFSTLKYLFKNVNRLNESEFAEEFYSFLERLSVNYAIERFCNNNYKIDSGKLRYDSNVPVFAFNFTDYVLWKNSKSIEKEFVNIKFEKFSFRYRRSIEHWYPQNPNETEGKKKLDGELLHSFANLCVIVASQNSAFGNLAPMAKLANWRNIFDNQSLKLQMMAYKTEKWRSWDNNNKEDIKEMEGYFIRLLNTYIDSTLKNSIFP